MSDASVPRYNIKIDEEDREYFKEFNSRKHWRAHLIEKIKPEVQSQRGVRYVRFAILAIVALVANVVLHANFGHKLPSWGVGAIMVALLVYPTLQFRELMQPLKHYATPQRLAMFLGIMYTTRGRKAWATPEVLEYALRDLFKLHVPTRVNGKGKTKPVKDAVDPYTEAVEFSPNATRLRRAAWLSVVTVLASLTLSSGFWIIILFAIGFASAILTVTKYRAVTLRTAQGLLDAAPSSKYDDTPAIDDSGLDILNPRTEDESTDTAPTGKKHKKADAKKTTKSDTASAADDTDEMHDLSDEELLQMVIAYHEHVKNHAPMDAAQRTFLEVLFGDEGVPTPDKLSKEIARSTAKAKKADAKKTTKSDTASAADDTGTTTLPPLPVRPKKATAPQTGPTGTPAHGIPVVSSALPADGNDGTMHRTVQALDDLFNKWLALGDDGLTPEENKAIDHYKKRAR